MRSRASRDETRQLAIFGFGVEMEMTLPMIDMPTLDQMPVVTDALAAETLAADNTPAALAESRAALQAQLALVEAQLQAQATAERESKRAEALESIKSMMAFAELTVDDLAKAFGKRPVTRMSPGEPKPSALTGIKLAPKYRDAETGETWSGRGLQPKWLKARIAGGAELESFAVAKG